MNALTGVAAMVFPMTSSGRSSAVLKRTHDFPMSSFLPAFLKPSLKAFAVGVSP